MYDHVRIHVQAGRGGDGSASLRREKFVPQGGPDGGDGGRGGTIILRADTQLQTLIDFRQQTHFKAGNGGHGGRRQLHGKAGENLVIAVPPGTQVRDGETGDLLADLATPGQEMEVVRGGRGGLGNIHFATSTHQTPRFAERGEPGQARWLQLDLKIIAQVGIIGYPNVGKSTLLAAVSAARPKIADYPFTTLEPNLGVADIDGVQVVLADIPGLIEGAHRGVGLGHEFLRHVERTRLLIHVLDGLSADPAADFRRVNDELRLFDATLADRPQIIALNKMDVPEAAAGWKAVKKALPSLPAFAISAATGQGLKPLLRAVARLLAELPAPPPPLTVVAPRVPNSPVFAVEKKGGVFVVTGQRVERLAARTDGSNVEAIRRFETMLRRLGVLKTLEEAGVTEGNTVRIGDIELIWGQAIRRDAPRRR